MPSLNSDNVKLSTSVLSADGSSNGDLQPSAPPNTGKDGDEESETTLWASLHVSTSSPSSQNTEEHDELFSGSEKGPQEITSVAHPDTSRSPTLMSNDLPVPETAGVNRSFSSTRINFPSASFGDMASAKSQKPVSHPSLDAVANSARQGSGSKECGSHILESSSHVTKRTATTGRRTGVKDGVSSATAIPRATAVVQQPYVNGRVPTATNTTSSVPGNHPYKQIQGVFPSPSENSAIMPATSKSQPVLDESHTESGASNLADALSRTFGANAIATSLRLSTKDSRRSSVTSASSSTNNRASEEPAPRTIYARRYKLPASVSSMPRSRLSAEAMAAALYTNVANIRRARKLEGSYEDEEVLKVNLRNVDDSDGVTKQTETKTKARWEQVSLGKSITERYLHTMEDIFGSRRMETEAGLKLKRASQFLEVFKLKYSQVPMTEDYRRQLSWPGVR